MLAASSIVQKVAGRVLEERDLAKPEVEEFYKIFGAQLQQLMAAKDDITQSKLIDLVQDAIDMTSTGSTGQAASSDWTDLRIDPTAYMAARPDHNDDGVSMPSLSRTDEDDNLLFQSDEVSDSDADIETGQFAWAETVYRALNKGKEDNSHRRTVNVYKDDGIWTLPDRGCNSNCHGREWAKNTDNNQIVKSYQGIGTATVKTYGKRCMPASIKLSKGRIVKALLESH